MFVHVGRVVCLCMLSDVVHSCMSVARWYICTHMRSSLIHNRNRDTPSIVELEP